MPDQFVRSIHPHEVVVGDYLIDLRDGEPVEVLAVKRVFAAYEFTLRRKAWRKRARVTTARVNAEQFVRVRRGWSS